MRHVPIGEFKDKVSEYVAAAEAGDEIVLTRHGREVARLTSTDAARLARQRAAVDALYALGQEIKAKHGPTTAAEIREWIEEGRR
jgi:prevent-host-death family protein